MAQVTKADTDAFLKAAATVKYEIHDGRIYVGSRISDDRGFVAPAPVPAGFAHLDPAEQPFIAMAILDNVGKRGGGNSKAKTAAEFHSAVAGALTSKDEESTSRVKDALVEAVAEDITPRALSINPNATVEDIKTTARGMAKAQVRVIAEGYKPLPKEKASTKAAAKAIAGLADE